MTIRSSNIVKRSMRVDGHRTSLALEPDFWAELEIIAAQSKISLSKLIASIDVERGDAKDKTGLASACRVYALKSARERGGLVR